MHLGDALGYLLVGSVFASIGGSMLVNQHGRLRFGRANWGRSSFGTFQITGTLAQVVGAGFVLGGLLFGLAPLIGVIVDAPPSSPIFVLSGIGMVIMLLSGFFGMVLQAAISLGEALRIDRDTSHRPNDENGN
jgi:hypothetical protein